MKKHYSSNEVAKMFGVSLRQLQWWDEHKLIPIRKNGHRREFGPSDALLIGILNELRKRGMSLQRVRKLFNAPTRDALTDGKVIYATFGKSVRCWKDETQLIEFLCDATTPQIPLRLSDISNRVK